MVLGRADLILGGMDPDDPLYAQRPRDSNAVMLTLSRIRWYSSVGIVTRSKKDWKRPLHLLLAKVLKGGSVVAIIREQCQ